MSNFGKDSTGDGSVTIVTAVTDIQIRLSQHPGRIELQAKLINCGADQCGADQCGAEFSGC